MRMSAFFSVFGVTGALFFSLYRRFFPQKPERSLSIAPFLSVCRTTGQHRAARPHRQGGEILRRGIPCAFIPVRLSAVPPSVAAGTQTTWQPAMRVPNPATIAGLYESPARRGT